VRPAAAAGWFDAADHAGAVLGAATAGLFLLPAVGLASTAALLAGTKLAGLAALLAAGRFRKTQDRCVARTDPPEPQS
jgi:hypothetical protein